MATGEVESPRKTIRKKSAGVVGGSNLVLLDSFDPQPQGSYRYVRVASQ